MQKKQEGTGCFNILSLGACLPEGSFHFHSRFKNAVNFIHNTSNIAVTLLSRQAGAAPAGIVCSPFEPEKILSLYIDPFFVEINGIKYARREIKVYSPEIEAREKIDFKTFYLNLNIFKNLLINSGADKSLAVLIEPSRENCFKSSFEKAFLKYARRCFEKIKSPDKNLFIDGIKKIKGAGFGLTPSGDDFVCGVLMSLCVFEKIYNADILKFKNEILSVSLGKNLLSNTFLKFAAQGCFNQKHKNLINALFYGSKDDVVSAAEEALFSGATSGRDTASGFLVMCGLVMEENFLSDKLNKKAV